MGESSDKVSWLGLGGSRIDSVIERLQVLLSRQSCPHVIIIHIGTNDILQAKRPKIERYVGEIFNFIRNRLPSCQIIWSGILPRLFWEGERNPGAGEKVRKQVNVHALKVCKEVIGDNRVIFHDQLQITGRDRSLYREKDGVHLEKKGLEVFRRNLRQALQFFRVHSKGEAPAYPPK